MARASLKLEKIIAPVVTALGCEFVGCEQVAQGTQIILRIYIDEPGGITLDHIERVSRQVAAVLDVEDPISGRYNLEVSSPGMDRPLFTLDHYQRFIDHQVKIRLRTPIDGRRNFKGLLKQVENEKITLQISDQASIELALNDIDKANLVPEF